MSISLVTRSGNGAPVTAAQNDANMAAIQTAVNQNITDISTKLATSSFFSYFAGLSLAHLGRVAVDWSDLTGKPTQNANAAVFRGVKTDAVQSIAASGSLGVHFGTEDFDYTGNFDPGTYRFTAPFPGVYQVNLSVQVSLASGSPTNVSIIANLRINGSSREQATLDNTGTGTRIYKCGGLFKMAAGDYIDATVDFTFSGVATWQIDTTNTSLSGFRVNTNLDVA